jgi:antirepressor protein
MSSTDDYLRHRVYVDILASDLWVAEDLDGELYFPVRASCAALELDSTTSLETIKADSRLAPGLRAIRLPTPPRGEREVQCLRSDEYTWWLALIDPRRFKAERRPLLEQRQRALMRLAKEIMLKRTEVHMLPLGRKDQPRNVESTGRLEGDFRCLRCGAPMHLTIDGSGWHLHLGVEVD